ncbi:hypothetical protein NHX12_011476 [Muraenolepis orangiensis]|uniref:Uncharacterized protein n=1 Tax=Muraenolepis orangiensis TaxID=630683 RepID=A0A9Q0DHT3_9TELE|nr:hypothetical protein NHX12_011476 [Muraenolepis orangiensis]
MAVLCGVRLLRRPVGGGTGNWILSSLLLCFLDRALRPYCPSRLTRLPPETTTQNTTQNPTQNPNQNTTQNPTQNPNQNPNQNTTQNPNQNPNQNTTQNPNQNPNQNTTQNLQSVASLNPDTMDAMA